MRFLFLLTTLSLFLSQKAANSIHQDTIPLIINALKSANVEELGKNFDNYIDFKLPEKEEIRNIGKTQAGIAMQTFYKENKITGFELASEREMGKSMYIAGKLTGVEKVFNITLLLKNKEGIHQIITVRIN